MDREDGKRLNIIQVLGRYKYALLVAALGAVLLLWPRQEDDAQVQPTVQHAISESDMDALEKKMEEILSKMNGVGRVDVLLTIESGEELVLATDSTLRYSGSPQNPDDYDRSNETVTVSGLITGQDLVAQCKDVDADEILIVRSMIRNEGDLFLDDMTVEDVRRQLPAPLRITENTGEGFWRAISGLEDTE